jgi:hypothetical protein
MTPEPAYEVADLRTSRHLVKRSQRTSGPAFAEDFIRSARWGQLVGGKGGRNGDVRLKLYLSLTLLAVGGDNDVKDIPAYNWARAIGLADPDGSGARRIQDALRWLHKHNYVRVIGSRGAPPIVQLRDPMGLEAAGITKPYTRASGGAGRWTVVPTEIWTNGWIMALSGRALAVLIVLLDHRTRGGIVPTSTKDEIGLSPSTWTRALRELQAPPTLVKVTREVRAYDPELGWRRARNIHELFIERLAEIPPKSLLVFESRNP